MKFDFKKLAESLGLDEATVAKLNGEEAQKAIGDAIDTQVEANQQLNQADLDKAKNDFKTKMNNLNTKLEKANSDLTALRESKGGEGGDAEELAKATQRVSELEGQVEELTTSRDTYKESSEKHENNLKTLGHKTTMQQAVADYNAKNPELTVKDDTMDVVIMLAEQHVRANEEGEYVSNRFDGKPLTTEEGLAQPKDWINYLRTEKPSLFNGPTGSGAAGSKAGGAGAKTMTRSAFEALPVNERAEIATSHTITD